MRLLDKYIAKHVGIAIVLVLVVIVGLDTLFSFLVELDDLRGDYQAVAAFKYVIYSTPLHLYNYMPFVVLIGCLLGLGVLVDNREVTVMRAAGVSIARIGLAVMLPVTIILLINVGLGEYPAPQLTQIVETQKDILRSKSEVISSKQGYWQRDNDQYIHFNAADTEGTLYGVVYYQFNSERKLQKVVFAKNARFDDQSNAWTLSDVDEVTLTSEGSHLQKYPSLPWQTTLAPTLLKTLLLQPNDQSISDLYHFGFYMKDQGLASEQYFLAFWRKLLQPLATISLVLISLSLLFGSMRTSTVGFRIFVGIIVSLLFQYSQDMLGSISLVYGLTPIMATAIPIVGCALVGVFLLKKTG